MVPEQLGTVHISSNDIPPCVRVLLGSEHIPINEHLHNQVVAGQEVHTDSPSILCILLLIAHGVCCMLYVCVTSGGVCTEIMKLQVRIHA
jgi:hypothetical protein